MRRDRSVSPPVRLTFPTIEHLSLELQFESSNASTPTFQTHVLHPAARAFFQFPCPYADCDGQFDLAAAVQAAVSDRKHQASGVLECQGMRAHRQGLQPCQLRAHYRVIATHRSAPRDT